MQLIGIVVSLTYILLSAGIILFAYNIDKFEEPFKCPKDIKIEFTDDVCYDPETYSVKTTIQNKGEERVDEFSVTLQYDTTSFMDLLDESLEQEHQMKIELPSILNHGTPRTLVITPNINNEYWTACWDRQINASITLCE